MTPKQQAFCEEYLKDFNATRAYKAVYKSVKNDETAAAAGTRLLKNVNVKAYIDKVKVETSNSRIADIIEIKEYFTDVLRNEELNNLERMAAANNLIKYVGLSKAEEMKYKNEAKRLELEEKRLELLLARETAAEDTETGIVMMPSVDLEAYEKEKEAVLKGLENG